MDKKLESRWSVTRENLRNLSLISEGSSCDDVQVAHSRYSLSEKQWRLSYLKEQFKSFELNNLFRRYTRKISHGYFSVFLILQAILSTIHFVIVGYTNFDKIKIFIVLPDLILYFLTASLSLIGLCVVDVVAVKYKKLHYMSVLAFTILYISNIFVPIYHSKYVMDHGRYRPLYTFYIILCCYIFFDIHNKMVAFIIGLFVSVTGIITLILITYKPNDEMTRKIISDIIFLVCVNGLGLYFRYMHEIAIRKSFLDRRDSITTTFQLTYEKNQVEQLMSNIIPKYLIDTVINNYIEKESYYIKTHTVLTRDPFRDTASLLHEHDNVSILFADIVHYTEMTQKLNITELLETLNDLFGEFDDISEDLKVTRIKFLGDCYYCVAGLPPDPAPNHAEAAVDLGLAMISIIADVRKRRKLAVDMRIGVHSGRITSGIIGSIKFQFDIWSNDVDIANKMESEGLPGRVHITNKTKGLLKKQYNIELTDKGETVPQFKLKQLSTYLITPQGESSNEMRLSNTNAIGERQPSPRLSIFKKNQSNDLETKSLSFRKSRENLEAYWKQESIEERGGKTTSHPYLTIIEKNNLNTGDMIMTEGRRSKKRFSNNPIRSLKVNERQASSDVKRRTAFMNNNIKRYAERTEAINKEMEETIDRISFSKYKQYFHPKSMNSIFFFFKNKSTEIRYITIPDPLFKYYLVCSVFLILSVYEMENITLKHWDITTWPFLAAAVTIIFLIPLSWTHTIWSRYVSSLVDEPPENKFLYILCESSKCITNSFVVRFLIYAFINILFCCCVLIETIDCQDSANEDNTVTKIKLLTLLESSHHENLKCIIPWYITQACALTVILTFVFLRIFIWIKILFSLIIVIVFIYIIVTFDDGLFEHSEPFNYSMQPRVAHVLTIIFVNITLILIDRQTDYMNRLDFQVNTNVKDEQNEANGLKIINKKLLDNILPEHVAKIYLDVDREMRDLYYEDHENVAVMFASLILDDELMKLSEKRFLIVMNEYISKFDTLINRKQFCNIEKIKLAKWTYMAACGLKGKEVERHSTSSNLETLLNFASQMYKALKEVDNFQPTNLRIGICNGRIVAGVVGSKKPLYDIWGDPVNMASRMDSTGVPNQIQVMEETAEIIERMGFECSYRGEIFVKGKSGLVKTYFVKLDSNYNLVKKYTNTAEL